MNIKKLLPFLFVVVILLSLIGCVSSEFDAQWRIQAYLERKYDGTFQVEEVTYIAPSPDEPFGVGYYTGTAVYVETGVSFEVVCQVVGTGDVCDYYTKALYGKQAEQEIRSVFAQYPAFGLDVLELNWYTSPDNWDPSIPFEELSSLLSLDATLTVPEEGLADQAEALLELCQALDALNSTMRFDITLHVDGVQAKAKMPNEHLLDVELIRSDLAQIAQYAEKEHKIKNILLAFQGEHSYLDAFSLSDDLYFVNSENAYFGVRLAISEVRLTEMAEDIFELSQTLRAQSIDFGLKIYNTDNQNSVFVRNEETENVACIEELLWELERSPSTQE